MKKLKHVQLFESFNSEEPIYVIDLMEQFPDMYHGGKGEAELKVYEFHGGLPDLKDAFATFVDPSFHRSEYKFKLEVETSDELHYGNTNTIYMGTNDPSIESILDWFRELLSDPSRDYLSW